MRCERIGDANHFTRAHLQRYIVQIDAANFGPGGKLEGMPTSTGNDVAGMAPDPDDDRDNDDNGTAVGGQGVVSKTMVRVPIDSTKFALASSPEGLLAV